MEQEYDFIMTVVYQLYWFCKTCHSKVIEVPKLVQGIKDRRDYIDIKFNYVSTNVENMVKIGDEYWKDTCSDNMEPNLLKWCQAALGAGT